MPSPTFIKSECSNEQLPATVEVKCQTTTKLTKTQLDPYFLIGCIVFLIVVLTLVVFGGYYLLTRSKRYSTTNSKDRKFLKQCIHVRRNRSNNLYSNIVLVLFNCLQLKTERLIIS